MILLSARDLSRQFDFQPVFQHLSLEVRLGDKIGLVGPNGVGKTTLLNILAGRDEPDTGSVELHPTAQALLLDQQPQFPAGCTLIEIAREGLAALYRLQREADEVAHSLAQAADAAEHDRFQKRYDALTSELQRVTSGTFQPTDAAVWLRDRRSTG